MEMLLDIDGIPENCHQDAHVEKTLMSRMLFIVQKVAIRTYDTDICDSFANLLNEVCDDVEVEPCLPSLQGETFANRTTTIDDDARLDIKANGFFDSRFSRTFFDVKVFIPYAKICPRSIPDSYKYQESIKKLKYEQRIIDVKKSTFCPSIFSCTGGAGPSASKAIERLASRISDKIHIRT